MSMSGRRHSATLPVTGLVLSAIVLSMTGCSSSGSGRTPPQVSQVQYLPAEQPQLLVSSAQGEVMVTLLEDDLVHIAYHDQLSAGTPFYSPMVVDRKFSGPSSYQYDEASNTLSSAAVSVALVDGCLRATDISGAEPLTLTQLCLLERDDTLEISMSQESFSQVYGLGQYLDSTNDNAGWIGEQRRPATQTGNAMTYSNIAASGDTQIPVGYVLGEGYENYGFFIDTHYPLTLDFETPEWTITSRDPSLGMFLFTGDNLKQLRSKYLELTGKPPVPPLKAFGLWVSEYGYDNWAELDSKLETLKQANFPIDGFVLDLQWFGGINGGSEDTQMGSLSWDHSAFPEPETKLATLASQNIGLVHIEESYVGAALPEYRRLAEKRQLAMDCEEPCTDPSKLTSNPWWGIGGMIDWTSASARQDWHTEKRVPLIEDGFLGHWTDLGEPEIYDYKSVYAGLDWYGEQRTDHPSVHNLLNFYWSQGIAEHTAGSHPDRRPWILSRSGTAGSQRFGVAMWSGDVASRFLSLEAQMPAQTNMSLSGFDYYGSDVGGFHRKGARGGRFDALYTRWLATSILMEIPLRPHTQNLCNCGETAPDRAGDSESNLANLRTRYRLTPYLYSLAHQASAAGEAIFPPLVYHFQQDPTARDEDRTKMIGESLLYTAIVDDDAQVSSYLPAGRWVNYYDVSEVITSSGASYERAVEVDGLVRAPLFLRAGAIVPTLANDLDNLGALEAGAIQWFDKLNVLAVADDTPHSFPLHEDDGLTRDYEQGSTAVTLIETSAQADGYQMRIVPNPVAKASAAKRQLTLSFIAPGDTVRQVKVNGSALAQTSPQSDVAGWYTEADAVQVKLGEVDVAAELDVRFIR